MRRIGLPPVVIAALFVASCGGGVAATSTTVETTGPPSAERGAQIYQDDAVPGATCLSCHSLDGSSQGSILSNGPTLLGISERAGDTVPGLSAEEYIRASIIDVAAYVVEGFSDTMPRFYGTSLTQQQIDDLVAFLLTQ